MELQTVAYVFIAIVAVMAFIHIFSTQAPDLANNVYCQLHQAANAIIFLTTKPPVPPECGLETSTVRKNLASKEEFANLVIDCWEKGQEGKAGTTFVCYELYWHGDEITEDDVTNILIQKNYCKTLPNNFLDLEEKQIKCGDENRLKWESDISDGTWIIKYDAFMRSVVVK